MGEQPFKPTHRVQIGTGRNISYVYVQIVSDAGKKNGKLYYNVIVSPDDKSGIHSLPALPQSCLEALDKEQSIAPVSKKTKKEKQVPVYDEKQEERYILKRMKEEEELLTIREAANALGVHYVTVRQWIFSGALEAMILPRGECQNSYLIKRSVINTILERKDKETND